jgi:hypothetical protein
MRIEVIYPVEMCVSSCLDEENSLLLCQSHYRWSEYTVFCRLCMYPGLSAADEAILSTLHRFKGESQEWFLYGFQ